MTNKLVVHNGKWFNTNINTLNDQWIHYEKDGMKIGRKKKKKNIGEEWVLTFTRDESDIQYTGS